LEPEREASYNICTGNVKEVVPERLLIHQSLKPAIILDVP
jgi:hypothetical protein